MYTYCLKCLEKIKHSIIKEKSKYSSNCSKYVIVISIDLVRNLYGQQDYNYTVTNNNKHPYRYVEKGQCKLLKCPYQNSYM